MKAALFDLDNTLYPEIEFVRSGFKAVAHYLNSRYNLDEQSILSQFLDILQKNGRGKIFDTLLHNIELYTEERVRLLVHLYRSHQPIIHLYPDVLPTFEYLRKSGIKLGLITDGMASVQKSKINALGLGNIFDIIMCTDELGREYWKPSTFPFIIALEILDRSPEFAMYIGDDMEKDFIAPNKLGMVSIQIDRGSHGVPVTSRSSNSACAKFVIKELNEIHSLIL